MSLSYTSLVSCCVILLCAVNAQQLTVDVSGLDSIGTGAALGSSYFVVTLSVDHTLNAAEFTLTEKEWVPSHTSRIKSYGPSTTPTFRTECSVLLKDMFIFVVLTGVSQDVIFVDRTTREIVKQVSMDGHMDGLCTNARDGTFIFVSEQALNILDLATYAVTARPLSAPLTRVAAAVVSPTTPPHLVVLDNCSAKKCTRQQIDLETGQVTKVGTIEVTTPYPALVRYSSAQSGDYYYFTNEECEVIRIHVASTTSAKMNKELKGVCTSPIIVGSTLYLGGESALKRIDLSTFKASKAVTVSFALSVSSVGWLSLAPADGSLVVASSCTSLCSCGLELMQVSADSGKTTGPALSNLPTPACYIGLYDYLDNWLVGLVRSLPPQIVTVQYETTAAESVVIPVPESKNEVLRFGAFDGKFGVAYVAYTSVVVAVDVHTQGRVSIGMKNVEGLALSDDGLLLYALTASGDEATLCTIETSDFVLLKKQKLPKFESGVQLFVYQFFTVGTKLDNHIAVAWDLSKGGKTHTSVACLHNTGDSISIKSTKTPIQKSMKFELASRWLHGVGVTAQGVNLTFWDFSVCPPKPIGSAIAKGDVDAVAYSRITDRAIVTSGLTAATYFVESPLTKPTVVTVDQSSYVVAMASNDTIVTSPGNSGSFEFWPRAK